MRHIREFVRQLNLQHIVIIGHSEGGLIGLWLTVTYPGLVKKLIIITSGSSSPILGGADDGGWRSACELTFNYTDGAETEEDFIRMNSRLSTTNPPFFTEMIRNNYRSAVSRGQLGRMKDACKAPEYLSDDEFKNTNIYPKLEELNIPVLLIWAREDYTVGVDRGLKLMDLLPKSEMHIFGSAAHFVMVDREGEFNRLLLSWIGDVDLVDAI
jgi:pimeloyl-ACP methyl ester carboxylesterase